MVKFREELPKEQLCGPTDPVEFEWLVRGHLEDVVLRRNVAPEPVAATTAAGGTSVTKLWFGLPSVVAAFSGRAGWAARPGAGDKS